MAEVTTETCYEKHSKLERRIEGVQVAVTNLNAKVLKLEGLVEDIHQISLNIQRLADKLDTQTDVISNHNARLCKLEDKPAKNWDTVIQTIITAVVGGMIGFFISLK